jgi:hypothetical protein
MSKGSHRIKSRSTTSRQDWSAAQIWMFIPPKESDVQKSFRQEVKRLAEDRNLVLRIRRAQKCPVVGGPDQGRSYNLIEPKDAAECYSALHRYKTLVIATGSCLVRRDPSVDPSRYRDLVSIENFVHYKAYFGMIRDHRDIGKLITNFLAWPPRDACSGPHDPRILPLNIFDSQNEWPKLGELAALKNFNTRFGPAGARTDSDGRSWTQSAALHGGDTLTVAGYQLSKGFHWDVARGQGKGRIVTASEVWKLANKNSYCNIYPDGYVRVGRKLTGGACRLVWSSS